MLGDGAPTTAQFASVPPSPLPSSLRGLLWRPAWYLHSLALGTPLCQGARGDMPVWQPQDRMEYDRLTGMLGPGWCSYDSRLGVIPPLRFLAAVASHESVEKSQSPAWYLGQLLNSVGSVTRER